MQHSNYCIIQYDAFQIYRDRAHCYWQRVHTFFCHFNCCWNYFENFLQFCLCKWHFTCDVHFSSSSCCGDRDLFRCNFEDNCFRKFYSNFRQFWHFFKPFDNNFVFFAWLIGCDHSLGYFWFFYFIFLIFRRFFWSFLNTWYFFRCFEFNNRGSLRYDFKTFLYALWDFY